MRLHELLNKALAVLTEEGPVGRPKKDRGRNVPKSNVYADKKYRKYDTESNEFKEGAVHVIYFRASVVGRYKYLDIHRKLSRKEYRDIVNNTKLDAKVLPSDKPDHFEDIYYVLIPKAGQSLQDDPEMKKYFTKIKLEDYNKLSDEDKEKASIELVPIEDIYNKGVGQAFAEVHSLNVYLRSSGQYAKRKPKTVYKSDVETEPETGDEEEPDYGKLGATAKMSADADAATKKARMDAANFIFSGNNERLLNNGDVEGFVKSAKEYTSDPLVLDAIANYVVRTRLGYESGVYKRIAAAIAGPEKPAVSAPKPKPSAEVPKKAPVAKAEKPVQPKAQKGVEYDPKPFVTSNQKLVNDIKDYYREITSKESSPKVKQDNQQLLTKAISEIVNKMLKEASRVQKDLELGSEDTSILYSILNSVVNQFSKEQDLAKMILSQLGNLVNLKEISATGGGAAPGTGATAVPGTGEGMATKYAFAGPGGTKAVRKKGILVAKTLKEGDVEAKIGYTPKKRLEIIEKAEADKDKSYLLLKNYANKVMNLTIYDMIGKPSKLDIEAEDGEILKNKFKRIYLTLFNIGEDYYREGGLSDPNYKRSYEIGDIYDSYQLLVTEILDMVETLKEDLEKLPENKEFMALIK